MLHIDIVRSAARERLPIPYRNDGYRSPSHIRHDSSSLRMVAALADPFTDAARSLFDDEFLEIPLTPFAGEDRESDAQYYGRRSKEEGRAAGDVAVPEARRAHQELADLYARLARRALRRGAAALSRHRSAERARVAGLLRQRFGLSISGPGRLPARHAFQHMQREARSRI